LENAWVPERTPPPKEVFTSAKGALKGAKSPSESFLTSQSNAALQVALTEEVCMTGADALSSQKTSQKPKNPVEGINCSSFSSSSVEMDKLLPIFIDWKGEQLRTASPSEQAIFSPIA
jgi:hypothetical protein